jgi:hypothetical protein
MFIVKHFFKIPLVLVVSRRTTSQTGASATADDDIKMDSEASGCGLDTCC